MVGTTKAPPRAPQSSNVAPWSFTALLAVMATILVVLARDDLHGLPTPLRLAWPVIAIGFALGHFASIRVEFRRHNQTIDLTDVVLLPAIVFAGATGVVLAAVVGTAIRAVWVRQSATKAAFNICLHATAVTAATLAFRTVLGDSKVLSGRGWLAAVTAMLVAEAVTHLSIQLIIALTTGRSPIEELDQLGMTVVSMVLVDTILGLVAVNLLWASVAGGILFVVVALAIGVEYANHGRLRKRHTTLEQLYHFEQALGGMVESNLVIAAVLGKALTLFNAEIAQLVLPDVTGSSATVCHTLRAGTSVSVTTSGSHAIADLLPPSGTLLASRTSRDPAILEALAVCGFRDAVALRLPSEVVSTAEVLVVADRLGGDDVTFEAADVTLAETLATPTAMALRSGDLLNQLRAEVALKEHQASHDALTGLANRTLFSSKVDRALAERPDDGLVGIMLIDLDGFKSLNDTLGHEAGDSFLQALAGALSGAIGPHGTVGRLGGDEFAVVMPEIRNLAELAEIAEELDVAVRAPVAVAGTVVALRASIGVTVAPLHGNDRFTLLREADLAMYRAKLHGGGVAFHDDDDDNHIDRPSLVAALREAIHNSDLTVRYQPKVFFGSAEVAGVEALVRWSHARYGTITPDQFIPVAESSGLIRPLTRWILETALAQCSAWQAAGIDLNIAVNLSPVQINDSEVVTQISDLLDAYGLDASCLTLEITESSALTDQAEEGQHILASLAALGVRLSIDDFGVGTSSLARLKHLPVSEIKIDKLFITNLTRDRTDDAIVSSTISLAHDLGLAVIAEGVETLATYDRLHALSCDIAQGYLFSAALTPDELARWVVSRSRSAPARTSTVA